MTGESNGAAPPGADGRGGPDPGNPVPGPCAKEHDRPLHVKAHVVGWLTCAAVLAVLWGMSLSPTLVEKAYADGVGQLAGRFLAAISAVAPFSLGEVLLAALLVWVPARALRAAYRVIRRTRHAGNALARGVLHIVTATSVLGCWFYLAWGLNYARADLPSRLNWHETAPADTENAGEAVHAEELAALCTELVEAANAAYAQALGSEDRNSGTDYELTPNHVKFNRGIRLNNGAERVQGKENGLIRSLSLNYVGQIDRTLERAYARVTERLGLHPSFAVSRGRAKPVLVSNILSHMLISGVYGPWTGEANYNRLVPGATLPLTLAHEKAHQRGIASEDEANFFGYLACACSDDPYVQYSGYLFAQQQLLGELARVDRDRAAAIAAQRYAGVQRDVKAERAFWAKYRGRVSQVSHAVNDAYLKAHRVKGGIDSYQRSAKFLVLFARRNGASCVVARPAGPAGA